MQCNQPYWYNGFQHSSQYPSFPPYQIQPPYPDIIGEGDVMSLTLPDGRMQYYFVPTNRRDPWISYNTNPNVYNSTPNWLNGNTAWFVRSILNTYPTGCNQSAPNHCGSPLASSCANVVNSQCQGYVQKFHNDSCTSTTDLHYFYPRLRSAWLTNNCAGIQVEIPKQEKTIFHYETVCNRPCHCSSQNGFNRTEHKGVEGNCTETPMSVDDVKSITMCYCNKEKKHNDHICDRRNQSKNISCVCRAVKVNTSDKAVMTYTDQAISCIEKKGCKSQTGIETEMCFTKRPRTKNIARSSNRSLPACDSSCCLGSTCCCNSDQVINK